MVKRFAMILTGLIVSIGTALAQSEISGTVISEDTGEPVVGATVSVVGTKTGRVTDLYGQFKIFVPEGKKQLHVQFIGMQPQTVTARQGIKIVLKNDTHAIDEVIVTGYGNFKKSSFTGAASTDLSKLEDVPMISLEDKLAGSVPGLQITNTSGAPGSVSSVRVRGMGSINAGNNPLYVIDGTPVSSGNINAFSGPGDGYNDSGTSLLSTINSNDIESITVIKDAAAASLYGSRAANGVIVITTKSGSRGKTHVDFRSDWGSPSRQ